MVLLKEFLVIFVYAKDIGSMQIDEDYDQTDDGEPYKRAFRLMRMGKRPYYLTRKKAVRLMRLGKRTEMN